MIIYNNHRSFLIQFLLLNWYKNNLTDMVTNNKMSKLSKLILVLSAALLAISVFVPLWRIELDAPQYPEGLALLIYTNKLGGNVDIINGLNHYIGMETLHANHFIEFTILPYIIFFYAAFAIVAAISGKRKMLVAWFIAFVIFGVVAMVDFWRWEYNYGHNLNPNAAIVVPGMAYQPPLIGFKQLLNFGAYSIPDIGGWLFIAAGALVLFAVVFELKLRKNTTVNTALLVIVFATIFSSCGQVKSEPIELNKDNCESCKMTIADPRFACEIVTKKGRVYKFDDIACLKNFLKKEDKNKLAEILIADFANGHQLKNIHDCYYVEFESINSPMQGNTIAFANKDSADSYAALHNTKTIDWNVAFR